MPKPFFWPDFHKIFSKTYQPRPRQASISRWLTSGMVLVVAVTVLLGGVPAVGIISWQLDQQVRLRVLNAQSSTQALYAAEQGNLLQLARLVSERPTLCTLLQSHDVPKLTGYLDVLRQDTSADTLAVARADGQIIASGSIELPPEVLLNRSQLPYADFIALENPSGLAIFAVSEVTSAGACRGSLTGRVVALHILDHDFMQELTRDTGLEQSLIIGEQRVATSFANVTNWTLNPDALSRVLRTRETCCTTGRNGNETYYVGLAPLMDKHGRVIALSEVALPADDIRSSVFNTLALFIGIGILAALSGSGLALVLTRRITRPLHTLSEAADRMGAGDLETPIPVTSGWIAIDRLASQLDRSRRNLRQIQQITRQEFRHIVHLLGATREGIISIDERGIITWVNSDACRLLGCDIRDLLGKHYLRVIRLGAGELMTLSYILHPPSNQPPPKHLTILNEQGHPITLTVSHSLLESEDKDPDRPRNEHVLILRDISEEQAINNLRSEFLANVAHEFRTPLSAVSASAELLMDEAGTMQVEELSHLARTINLSVVHLQALVNNLLESAIIEAGVFRLRIRPLQVREVLEEVVEMMSPLLQRREQCLEMVIPEDLPPQISGDADRLKQALVNLLENASKFSPSGTSIVLSVKQDGDILIFSVSDSGPGLPTERFDSLLSRFFTGDRPRGAQYGIGLGLPIVKAIAEAHGGAVGAENRPAGGARVWLRIPLKQPGKEGEN